MPELKTHSPNRRIAIAVQGRFHAFDLACALLADGHDVYLLTTQPAFLVQRSGFPKARVISNVSIGIAQRLARRLTRFGFRYPIKTLTRWFGAWVARKLSTLAPFDVLHLWSETAEETLRSFDDPAQLRMVVRGSSHIRYQQRLLREESVRSGAPQEMPSEWICAREEREYALAHFVVVPSNFALQSFIAEGVHERRLLRLIPGSPAKEFLPDTEVVSARFQRYQRLDVMRVLLVGTVCYRKGLFDVEQLVRALPSQQFEFRWVGQVNPEASGAVARLRDRVEFTGALDRSALKAQYAWGDVFLLPTIEDGYPQVLVQAAVSGLPLISTPNGSGTDLIESERNGWVVSARAPEALADCLTQARAKPALLEQMSRELLNTHKPRGWAQVAAEYRDFLDRWFVEQTRV